MLRDLSRRLKAERKAGGIVVAGKGAELRVLLVSNRSGNRWIFPKGRLKHGERMEAAAVRETAEETGVRGAVVGYAGATLGWERGRRVRTEYYLLQARELTDPEAGRQVRWCTVAEAPALLGSPRLRRLWLGLAPKLVQAA